MTSLFRARAASASAVGAGGGEGSCATTGGAGGVAGDGARAGGKAACCPSSGAVAGGAAASCAAGGAGEGGGDGATFCPVGAGAGAGATGVGPDETGGVTFVWLRAVQKKAAIATTATPPSKAHNQRDMASLSVARTRLPSMLEVDQTMLMDVSHVD